MTPRAHWLDRRAFMASAALLACSANDAPHTTKASPLAGLYPAPRNPKYVVHQPLTDERVAARYNNFYEFTTDKAKVWRAVRDFEPYPWTVQIGGLCGKKGRFSLDDLLKRFTLEERVYRFRCVEAWSMVVPWTGFPLSDLVRWAEPDSGARYVRFTTAERPKQMPGVREQPWLPWPYFEALTLAEATNPLSLLVTGIYGHELPKQHGAPIRLIAPWKYGFKSIKSVAHIEFLADPPRTFWNALAPHEYDFLGNVRPDIPHPRWSQASERVIGTGERRPTHPYNGYAEQVAHLYRS